MKCPNQPSLFFRSALYLAFIAVVFISSCKKDEEPQNTSPSNSAPGEFVVSVAPDLNEALLSWTMASDPDGDAVVYMTVLGEDTLTENLEQTFYEVMELEFETEYFGSVIASDSKGAERAADFSFSTGMFPNAPPLAFDLVSPSDGQTGIATPLLLDWNGTSDPDGDAVTFEVLLDQNDPPVTSIVVNQTQDQINYSGSDLLEGETYYWQVVAHDGNGGQAISEVYSFTLSYPMTLASDEPGWANRTGHQSLVFQGKMWVIGGDSGNGGRYGDVWSSSDGISWIEEVADAPWDDRTIHACTVFDDKIWLIGGNASYNQSSLFGDVWSSEDGVNWQLVTDNPPFAPRQAHHLLSYDGYMWMYGGQDYDGDVDPHAVWRSMDGIDWELLTEEGPYYNVTQMVVFNDKMWRIAAYNDDRIQSTSNGVDWTLELEEAPFGERNGHTCTVHNGRIWLFSGSNNQVNELMEIPDVWSSEDGVNWQLETHDGGFDAVNNAESLSFDGKVWLLGGGGGWQSFFVTNDVWFLE